MVLAMAGSAVASPVPNRSARARRGTADAALFYASLRVREPTRHRNRPTGECGSTSGTHFRSRTSPPRLTFSPEPNRESANGNRRGDRRPVPRSRGRREPVARVALSPAGDRAALRGRARGRTGAAADPSLGGGRVRAEAAGRSRGRHRRVRGRPVAEFPRSQGGRRGGGPSPPSPCRSTGSSPRSPAIGSPGSGGGSRSCSARSPSSPGRPSVLPLLRHVRLQRRAASFLRWEAIVNDPIGAILAALTLDALLGAGASGARAFPSGSSCCPAWRFQGRWGPGPGSSSGGASPGIACRNS